MGRRRCTVQNKRSKHSLLLFLSLSLPPLRVNAHLHEKDYQFYKAINGCVLKICDVIQLSIDSLDSRNIKTAPKK